MTEREALTALHLSPGCSRAEIRTAYLDLVKVWHPDRFQGDPRLRAKAERTLQHLNDAYEFLQRPVSDSSPGQTDRPFRSTPADRRSTPETFWRSWPPLLGGAVLVGLTVGLVASVAWWPAPAILAPGVAEPMASDVALPAPRIGTPSQPPGRAAGPLSGTEMLVPQRTGRGALVVHNNGRRDAVIVLARANSTERAVYIRAGEQVTVLNVAPGAYRVIMMMGDEWTDDHFARNAAYEQLERTVEFAEQTTGATTEYTRLSIAFQPGVVGPDDRRAVSPFTLGSPLSMR